MNKITPIFFFCILFSLVVSCQETFVPYQPKTGPGSPTYIHSEVNVIDHAQEAEGYWIYEPAAPVPQKANVVVFVHGYGGYNPMIYGQWIDHLVKKGNIVIYPRYQKNNWSPRPPKFVENVAIGVKNALRYLENKSQIQPIVDHLSFVGHSYGGVISANLAINFEAHNLPKPKSIMLVSPGSGPFTGGVLDSYEKMPADVKMLVMVSDNDRTVGDKLGIRIFETATQVTQRNFIRQYHDNSISPAHYAGHNESYAVDLKYDNGIRNFTAKRALRMGSVNNIDYFGYWKLFDALLDCTRNEEFCTYAFGNTNQQNSLGIQSDGTPLRPLEVTVPAPSSDSRQAMATSKKDKK